VLHQGYLIQLFLLDNQHQFMQGELKKMIAPHQAGFTLIELITNMIIVGILSVVALPRFADQGAFNSRGFHDETLSLLRYAQKTAIAQRRTVCVAFNGAGLVLTMDTDTPADGACNAAPLTLPNPPRGGAGLVSPVASMQFTPEGNTNQAGNVTINIANSTNITVESGTGYVYD
jgi:MSHA pilin protein MshC